MSKVLPCPVKDCPFWFGWGGHLDLMLRQARRHVQAHHTELSAGDRRSAGGIVDRTWGDALLNTIGTKRHD